MYPPPQKVLKIVSLYSKYTRALTFENLCRKVERYPPPPPLVSLAGFSSSSEFI
jgi:hypothetical protein